MPLFGTYRGWTPAMIQSLYSTHEAYVAAIKQSTAYDVKKGWLLPADAKNAIAKAEGFTAPGRLAAATNSQTQRRKPEPSRVRSPRDLSPTLMTLGDTAPLGGFDAAVHDVNCDVVVEAGF